MPTRGMGDAKGTKPWSLNVIWNGVKGTQRKIHAVLKVKRGWERKGVSSGGER